MSVQQSYHIIWLLITYLYIPPLFGVKVLELLLMRDSGSNAVAVEEWSAPSDLGPNGRPAWPNKAIGAVLSVSIPTSIAFVVLRRSFSSRCLPKMLFWTEWMAEYFDSKNKLYANCSTFGPAVHRKQCSIVDWHLCYDINCIFSFTISLLDRIYYHFLSAKPFLYCDWRGLWNGNSSNKYVVCFFYCSRDNYK